VKKYLFPIVIGIQHPQLERVRL